MEEKKEPPHYDSEECKLHLAAFRKFVNEHPEHKELAMHLMQNMLDGMMALGDDMKDNFERFKDKVAEAMSKELSRYDERLKKLEKLEEDRL